MSTELAPEVLEDDEEPGEFPRDVLTLDQFLLLPEIKPALEFIRGRIEQKMSPNLHHSLVQLRLPARINGVAEPMSLGLALPELRCSFDGESYVPDISYFILDRLPIEDDGSTRERVTVPPDWSIEILSPGQTVKRLTACLKRLLKKGVRLGWLVQPRKRRVLVFRPGRAVEELGPGDMLTGDPVLPGFALPVEELFGWLKIQRG